MPPGEHNVMSSETREALSTVLNSPTFQSAAYIAQVMGKGRICTEQKLRRLYDRQYVERMQEPLPCGGFRYLWRAVPAGYMAPLYDAQPGVDGRALDECLGGFMYRKLKVNAERKCQTET